MGAIIPDSIRDDVLAAIASAGGGTKPRVHPAARGGVSSTLRLRTDSGDYFLKWNGTPWYGTFTNETFQLELLRNTSTLRVPDVIQFEEPQGDKPAWMLQTWSGKARLGDEPRRLGARLGEQLAALHDITAGVSQGYGYIERMSDGRPKELTQDWITFFYEGHLRHNIERARREGRWTVQRTRRVDRLVERLPELLGGVARRPAMLHGDLHSGNVRLAPDGEPVVVDPWLMYGDRELEIACTRLSGNFTAAFYDAYNAILPLEPDWRQRIQIYNLVWLLGPLHYASTPGLEEDNAAADPILKRFVG